MTSKETNKRKLYMTNTTLTQDEFSTEFNQLVEEHGIDWKMQGFVDSNNRVYPIDTDTKVLSTVFERLASPVIQTIANEHGYTVELANQTTYPDFTLNLMQGDTVIHRIAIDVKTTYRGFAGRNRQMVLTLGSYKSFIRDNTKNILYPYDTYSAHWILGFVYSRNENTSIGYDLNHMPSAGEISCPYSNISTFIRDKVGITGIRAGSGNTANIGSIKVKNPDFFSSEDGPFTQF
jgi:hypothetical protein